MTRTIVFERRAAPVQAEHRPLYKIAQILLLLNYASRGGRSKLPRLQLLLWTLRRTERITQLTKDARSGQLSMAVWGFDPALPAALRFALGDGLVTQSNTGVSITPKGREFAVSVWNTETMLAERQLCSAIKTSITEKMIESRTSEWGIQ